MGKKLRFQPPRAAGKSGERRFTGLLISLISRFALSPVQVTFAISILIGVVSGVGAYLFESLIWLVEELCGLATPESAARLGWWLIFLPALGGLMAGPLTRRFAREAAGHGVPEVMLAVAKYGGRIRPVVALIKSLASALTIGTGGSAGSEGPIVQIGAGFGSTIGQILRMPPVRLKTFAACGAAGGIAAIFNAPFGGIMFSLEVILNEFRGLSFIYVAIASVAAALVSRVLTGNQSVFPVNGLAMAGSWEIIAFAGLGAFVAFVAKLLMVALSRLEGWYDRLKINDYLKPATGGLVVGLLAYGAVRLIPPGALDNPVTILGVGYRSIRTVLDTSFYRGASGPLLLSLFLVMVLKIVATGFTLGSKGSGGVLAPSLFIGAMAGGMFGIVMGALFPGKTSSPAVYSLVGMGACFAGAALAPMTSIFILFEITGGYEIILPIIAASVVSTLTAHWLKPESIYTEALRKYGVDLKRKRVDLLQAMLVQNVMIRKVQTVPASMPWKDLREQVGTKLHTTLPVVDEKMELVGIITYKEFHQAVLRREPPESLTAFDLMNPAPVTAFPDESVDVAFRRMKEAALGAALVVNRAGGPRVVGLITYGNIFEAYERALSES